MRAYYAEIVLAPDVSVTREFVFESITRNVDRDGCVWYELGTSDPAVYVLVGLLYGKPAVAVPSDGRNYGGPRARTLLAMAQRLYRDARRQAARSRADFLTSG